MRAALESILAKHTGRPAETLRHDTDRDRVFTADAAVQYGLADHVLHGRE
jgi:ATP-dependent Clp protease protease subunit